MGLWNAHGSPSRSRSADWPGSQKKGAQKNTTRMDGLADDCGCGSKS
jgi:hypothetical protein